MGVQVPPAAGPMPLAGCNEAPDLLEPLYIIWGEPAAMITVRSKNKVAIRLTRERWEHIAARHPEMAGYKDEVLRTVSDPDLIQQGDYEMLLAIRRSMKSPFNLKNIIVVYKEKSEVDGFIITAYFATELSGWRKVLWRR